MGAGAGSGATGDATVGAAMGAAATVVAGTFGGSISAVYSRTRRPRDQLSSTKTLMNGSLIERDEVIFA